jgi:hypothetical protein
VPVSVVGWWVARRLARVLTDTPVVPVAQAQAGYVALRGRAQPLPNRPPLTSPNGTPCVWYRHSHQTGTGAGSYHAADSVQPFLLVDESGKCIVLPAGANISGGQDGPGLGGRERLIAEGDPIYVTGEFRPASSETVQQLQNVPPEPLHASVSFAGDNPAEMGAAAQRAKERLHEAVAAKAAAASIAPLPVALPVICAPADRGPFMIAANKDGASEESWWRLLANMNGAILLGSSAMLSYLVWAGR